MIFAINDIQQGVKSIYKAAAARRISAGLKLILRPDHRPTASKIAAHIIAGHKLADYFPGKFRFSRE